MGFEVERTTKETDIAATFDVGDAPVIDITTGLPFFDHMLGSFAFHGRLECQIKASGDIDVDPHHLVEDVGIVLGDCILKYAKEKGPLSRFGHAVVPMDDALSSATIDLSGRPYLAYRATFPQERVGTFSISLVREFLLGLSAHAMMNLHAECRYGENSHHMVEALFKAVGRALRAACTPSSGEIASTKGVL